MSASPEVTLTAERDEARAGEDKFRMYHRLEKQAHAEWKSRAEAAEAQVASLTERVAELEARQAPIDAELSQIEDWATSMMTGQVSYIQAIWTTARRARSTLNRSAG